MQKSCVCSLYVKEGGRPPAHPSFAQLWPEGKGGAKGKKSSWGGTWETTHLRCAQCWEQQWLTSAPKGSQHSRFLPITCSPSDCGTVTNACCQWWFIPSAGCPPRGGPGSQRWAADSGRPCSSGELLPGELPGPLPVSAAPQRGGRHHGASSGDTGRVGLGWGQQRRQLGTSCWRGTGGRSRPGGRASRRGLWKPLQQK